MGKGFLLEWLLAEFKPPPCALACWDMAAVRLEPYLMSEVELESMT